VLRIKRLGMKLLLVSMKVLLLSRSVLRIVVQSDPDG